MIKKYFKAMYVIFNQECTLAKRRQTVLERENIRIALHNRLEGVTITAIEDDDISSKDFHTVIKLKKNMFDIFDSFYLKGWR